MARAKVDAMRDSVREMRTAVSGMQKSASVVNPWRFWKIAPVVGKDSSGPEEFYASCLSDAFKMARNRWPYAMTYKCLGNRE